ncbi:aminotransferase class IV [Sphingobium sufflavum]|nr:aminotransferase class IV [Sphingobium sufflavum]MCE7795247.1 aminotransferase class IV [Sphingobium sufflavum]
MALDPHEGITHLERHIARMQASAELLGFRFDRHRLRNELQAATFRVTEPSRVRMMLSRGGALAVEVRSSLAWPNAVIPVAVVPRPVPVDDIRLYHKTTDRSPYDAARAAGGTFEVLMTDPDGYLTEGSFTSVFLERDERLVTPPLSRGLLPGVLRQHLIEIGEAVEGDIRVSDIKGNFFIGNAARGLVAATLVARRGDHG